MTKTHQLRLSVDIAAPRPSVWNRVSDHEGIPRWTPVREVQIVEAGKPERNGLGAVRAVKLPGVPVIRERVTRYEEGRMFEYKIIAGFPGLADHLGRVTLDDVASGVTRFRWDIDIRFKSYHPFAWIAGRLLPHVDRAITARMRELRRQIEAETVSVIARSI
jgi:uncharacterized protein YndB with AHSA1/START domain